MSNKPKRVGFLDYKLGNFHSNVYLGALRNELKDRGYTVSGCFGFDAVVGKEWAAKNDVTWFDRAEALNEQADCFMVLAPGNPETHLDLCERCFPFGKPTYVDKTFAPDLPTARRIFELADRYGTAVQTTSALRYTNVQTIVREMSASANGATVQHMVAWSNGRSFDEYAIHPLELIVSCMGPDAVGLMRRGTGTHSQLLINFTGERTAVANLYVANKSPIAAGVTVGDQTRYVEVNPARLFIDTASAILDFFEAGAPNIDRRETLTIRSLLDAAADPRALREFTPLR